MFGLSRAAPDQSADALRRALEECWAVIEFTPDGTILRVNKSFIETVGYSEQELVGKHHSMLCPPEVAQSEFYKTFWTSLAAGKPANGRFKRRDKNGQAIFLRASYMPLKDAAGQVTRVVKIAADVSKDADAELDANGKLEAISRVQAIIEFDVEGRILTANENFLKTMGYRLDEIKGKHHRIFMPAGEAESPEYARFWKALGQGESFTKEFRRRSKDGVDVWIAASYNPVMDRYGKVLRVVKFATNVTPRMHSVETLGEALDRLSNGDLTRAIDTPLQPAYEPLRLSVNKVVDSYRGMVERIGSATETLRRGSGRISNGATDLSDRAEQQAATLEEVAATIEELSGAITSTAQNSRHGTDVVRKAAERTESGQAVIEQATDAVRTIEESSRKINEINSVIESIAFQTNLLALNAAVEAARAGEAGKGFAVVASEVRNLAQRSSDAAADTSRLIKESSGNVERGAQLMTSAVQVFGEIREQVDALARSIADIDTANTEQAAGVNEINSAVADLDANTQANAHAAVENAAAARSLDSELSDLAEMLEFFRIGAAPTRSRHAA
ncbi:MAG: chemotaxis protein [Rhodobacteraceae bacterium]|nr:chemotaxis protein [Paracoccaceae bacterium]MBR27741.1 chemotaxis protein [Paracoccaceae bacterium]